MASKLIKSLLIVGGALSVLATGAAFAAGGGNSDYKMEHKDWSFNGACL